MALEPMVENSASGILLLARPDFSVGDQIMTSVYRGTVEKIGGRSTTLRQSDGVLVYISNNQVLGNPIVVYSSTDGRKARVDIVVPSETDPDEITSVLTAPSRRSTTSSMILGRQCRRAESPTTRSSCRSATGIQRRCPARQR